MSAIGNTSRGYKFKTCPTCGRRVAVIVPGTLNAPKTLNNGKPYFQSHNVKHADGTYGDICESSNKTAPR